MDQSSRLIIIDFKQKTSKPPPKPRQKRWSPKTRTGCLTCRVRRIKCDEGKPRCKRCILARLECHDRTESSLSRTGQPSASVPALSSCLMQQPRAPMAPPSVTDSPEERAMMHFFHTDTVVQIASVFDSQFWAVEVPRAAHVYPTIWHASLALAAMHKRHAIPDGAAVCRELSRDRDYKLSLEHYGAAMRHLVQIAQQDALSYGEKEALLLSTIFFTGICRLEEDLPRALAHIRNGLKLFRLWRMWEATPQGGVLSIRPLVALFNQFQQFLAFQNVTLDQEWPPVGDMPLGPAAEPFASMREAYLELEHLQAGSLGDLLQCSKLASTDLDHALNESRAACLLALRAWEIKFSELQKTQQLQSIDVQLGMLLQLRLSCAKMELAVECEWGKDSLCWDEFQPAFMDMIEVARGLLELMQATRPNATRSLNVSFTPSLSGPLYSIASACRNFEIRREAIALLKQCPRSEGTWDIGLAVAIAEARMRLEEDAVLTQSLNPWCNCARDVFVCARHRVTDLQSELLRNKRASVTLRTADDVVQGRAGTLATIGW